MKPCVESTYLHEFFLSTSGTQLTASLARGGVQKNINGSQLLEQNVPFPPIERQREAVSQLARVRHAIAQARARLVGLRTIKRALFLELLKSSP